METVRLRNGAEEASVLVRLMMWQLGELFKTQPIHFYELVMLCRDPAHRLFGATADDLAAMKLVTPVEGRPAQVHDSIRNIVLSAVDGEDFEMVLRNPVIEAVVSETA